jgi:hypothetical protein
MSVIDEYLNERLDDIEAAERAMSVHCCPFVKATRLAFTSTIKAAFTSRVITVTCAALGKMKRRMRFARIIRSVVKVEAMTDMRKKIA